MSAMNPHIKHWLVAGTVALLGACGDDRAGAADSQGGASTGATDGTQGRPTEGSTTTSGGGASDSRGTTEDAGSLSDSATMATTQTSAELTDGGGGSSGDTSSGSSSSSSTSGTSTGGDPLAACTVGNTWTLDADFDAGTLANTNHAAPNGDQLQISLDGFSAPRPYMFIAQPDDGRILKLDTVTGKQLARYPALRISDCPKCGAEPAAWKPSHIIVDLDGDAHIANRAFKAQGSMTRIAGSDARCIDRDGDGIITTSRDLDDDGIINVGNPAEYPGQGDECLIDSTAVGGINGFPLAITLDNLGHAYVGTFNEPTAYKLDLTQSPPVLLEQFKLASSPHGFALRGDYLYQSGLSTPTSRHDLVSKLGATMAVANSFGVAVDAAGIAWYGAKNGLARCDHDAPQTPCDVFDINDQVRGVAVDPHGQIWASTAEELVKFSAAGVKLGSREAPGPGVAIGHDGNPRVIGMYAAYTVAAGPVGGPPGDVTIHDTGHLNEVPTLNDTISDFTGFAARNISARTGEWSVVHDGLDADTEWVKVPYNTDPAGAIPPGTSITVAARAADTKAALAARPWTPMLDGALAEPVHGRFIEIRARLLITDPQVTESPVLSDVCVLKAGE
jgi:hypothetical protein